MNSNLSKFLRALVIFLIALGLLSLVGIRFAHPKSGLKSALGPADSSIAIYFHTSNVTKGSKVIVGTSAKIKGPTLAIVSNVSGTNVDIQAGSDLQRVTPKNISGKLLAIIPFVGYIFKVIGL